jgi:hypothetical protein
VTKRQLQREVKQIRRLIKEADDRLAQAKLNYSRALHCAGQLIKDLVPERSWNK